MPNESGLDLMQNLRNQNFRYDVILMSSFVSAAERKQAKDLGAYALLDKPFRLSELLQVVSQLVERQSSVLPPMKAGEKTTPNQQELKWT
jgi:DNA-binding response OmpR family regulator